MKLLHILFSFYLAALSIMPCTDIADPHHDEVAGMETSHSEANHKDCEDTCPPFCSCNCCGINVAFFYPDKISFAPSVFAEKGNTILTESSFPILNFSIWQPPKI